MTALKLPTKKTAPVTNPADLSILIYGQPKIGKSTFCSEMEGALFLATEPGLNSLDTFQVDITDWQKFLDACNLISLGEHEFKTVVIDTVDQLFWMCSQHMCKKHGIDHESDAGFGKGYAFVLNEFKRVLNGLANLPYGLVLVSHSQQVKMDDRTGEYMRTTTTLTGKPKQFISGFVDMILYFDSIIRDKDGISEEVRIIRTKPSKFLEAGDRTGKLPEAMKMDTKEFYKQMGVALETTEKNDKTKTETVAKEDQKKETKEQAKKDTKEQTKKQ